MKFYIIWLCILKILPLISITNGTILQASMENIEIEDLIPKSIDKICPLLVLSKTGFDFYSTTRPVIVFDDILEVFPPGGVLPMSCGVLFIPDFQDVFGQFLNNPHLVQRFERAISTILVFATTTNITTIKRIRNVLKMQDLVLFDPVTGLRRDISRPKCGGNLRCALRGQTFRVGYVVREPYLDFLNKDEYKVGEPVPDIRVNSTLSIHRNFSGPEADALDILINHYGMSFVIVSSQGLKEPPKATWRGRYGQLSRNEVDMLIGHVIGSYEKHEIGQFSKPLFIEHYTFCSRAPSPLSYWEAPLRPFPLLGWTLLLSSILVVGPSTWWITKMHRRVTKTITGKDPSVLDMSGRAGATLFVEPWYKPPEGPGALIVLIWIIGCLILQCVYNSNFSAHLSVPPLEKSLNTISDIIESQHLVLVSGIVEKLILRNDTKNAEIKKLEKRIVHKESAIVGEQLLDAVLDNYIVMSDPVTFSYLIEKHKKDQEDFHISPKPFWVVPCGWMFAEDDGDVARAINKAISRLTENGLLARWRKNMQKGSRIEVMAHQTLNQKQIERTIEHKELALSISHVEGIFGLWFLGLGLSLLVFGIEQFFKWPVLNYPRRPDPPPYGYLR